MGILAKTTSITQLKVVGEIPSRDRIAELLAQKHFEEIDSTPEPMSAGWVSLDDSDDTEFSTGIIRDHFAAFSLRVDKRRIPGALLRRHTKLAEEQWLLDHPGLQRVPKPRRQEIREAVTGALMAKTLPAPSVCDAVWDLSTNILSLASISHATIEIFEAMFKTTFEGCRLVVYHPFDKAADLLANDSGLLAKLHAANNASTDGVLDLIESNLWFGQDLLLWLTYMTDTGGAPLGAEVVYVGDKMTLLGDSDDGKQKITAAGPMNNFAEIRAALAEGKQFTGGQIYFESAENLYSLYLDAALFRFRSLKTPAVKLETDAMTDPAAEAEAVFYEKMYLLEQANNLFRAALRAFLELRLSDYWKDINRDITEWANG